MAPLSPRYGTEWSTASGSLERYRRRGSIYVAVLAVASIIAALGVGGIMASRVQTRSGDDGRDIADARYAAQSGLDVARQWIAVNSNWRTSGVTSGSFAINGCTVALAASNSSTDSSLSAIPLDPIYVSATATKGTGVKQALGQTVVGVGTPQDFLGYGVHVAGVLHITAGDRLICNQTVSSNDEFRTEGVLEGAVVAKKITLAASGAAYGGVGTLTTSRSLPATTNAETFASIGTLIPTGNLNGVVMGPGLNPFGTANANGVYVMRAGNTKVTISNSRIAGTLVIFCTKDVTISGSVLLQPARRDFPTLIVTGDTNFNYTTSPLSESSLGVNLNPLGLGISGTLNTSLSDTFASEIDGLIDIGGQLTLAGNGLVRGAIVCAATGNDAVKVTANPFQVIYDPTLFSSPPNYYTTAVTMTAQAGSISPIVK